MKKTFTAFSLSTLAYVALSGHRVLAEDRVPDFVRIGSLAVNGDGCPLDSVFKSVSADRQAFHLQFSQYVAEFGPYIPIRDQRKFCQITLSLDIPDGWRFAIASFTYRGFLAIDEGVEAEHVTDYYFQGDPDSGRFQEKMTGPRNENFVFQQQVPPGEQFWSGCEAKRAINIKTSIRVRPGASAEGQELSGVIGTDVVDGKLSQQSWRLYWQRCG